MNRAIRNLTTLLLITSWIGLIGCGEDDASLGSAVVDEQVDMMAPDMQQMSVDASFQEIPKTKEEAAKRSVLDGEDWQKLDICIYREWYDDGVCDWFCPRWDKDCAPEPVFPTEPVPIKSTKYPVLLLHGFSGGTDGVWSFWKVVETLTSEEVVVAATKVPPYDTIPNRAEVLRQEVDAYLKKWDVPKVNLVAHSMGGLDARYLISKLGYHDRVASLTTVSTPHRGTLVADIISGIVPGFTEGLLNGIATLLGQSINNESERANLLGALREFSQQNIETFNQDVLDHPDVTYLSWAGVSHPYGLYGIEYAAKKACQGKILGSENHFDRTNLLLLSSGLLLIGKPSDGLVPVESAIWGEFQGCVPADHIDEIGQIQKRGPDRRTGFDHLEFYRQIVRDLIARGY